MGSYLRISNSGILYMLAGIVIAYVLLQSSIFLKLSLSRAKELGMDRKVIKNTIKSSAVFAIVPSLPIVISLISIAPLLGIPFSWLRLSIIGSATYELIAADIGAKSMGVLNSGAGSYTAEVFANSMWVMSIGIIWGLLLCIFFLRRYLGKMESIKQKDSGWSSIMISALFFGMLSVFIGPPVVQGGISLMVLLCSALTMVILNYITKRFDIKWLVNFNLTLSMLSGMLMAVVIS